MQPLKIYIRKPGESGVQTVVLGRFGSMVVTLWMVLMVIAMVTAAIVFGYLVMGMVFAALLIAFVVALIRGASQSLRR